MFAVHSLRVKQCKIFYSIDPLHDDKLQYLINTKGKIIIKDLVVFTLKECQLKRRIILFKKDWIILLIMHIETCIYGRMAQNERTKIGNKLAQ